MTTLKIPTEKALDAKVQNKLVKSKDATKQIAQFYATGRRKSAVARVWIEAGSGAISVNKKNIDQYFPSDSHVKSIFQPFVLTKTSGQYNVKCTVSGGGTSGQVGAILHGIARALDKASSEFHTLLRKDGFLTRDPRVVERKKYGKHKARKSTQFSKR